MIGLIILLASTGNPSAENRPESVSTMNCRINPSSTEYFSLESFSLPKHSIGWIESVIPIDFDHDGDLDVIFGEGIGPPYRAVAGPGHLTALKNDGKGHYTDATAFVFKLDRSYGSDLPVVADFNKDGRQDLFMPVYGGMDWEPWFGAQNQLFIQTPRGTLADRTNTLLPSLLGVTSVAAGGDIDHDGDIDIYCCNLFSIFFPSYFLINDGKGKFTQKYDNFPAQEVYDSGLSNSCLLLDVDKDGDLDLILGGDVGTVVKKDRILLNDGTGHFVFTADSSMPLRRGGEGYGSADISSADFNKDGWPDLILRVDNYSVAGSQYQLMLNNGDGTFRDATDSLRALGIRSGSPIVAVDINNDGWTDFIDVCDDSGVKIFLNKGNAQFVESSKLLLPPFPAGTGISRCYPYDLDKDGDIDIFGVGCPGYWDGQYIQGTGNVLRNLKPYAFKVKVLFPALLSAPSNGATGKGTSVVLRWTDQNKKPYPDESHYQVRIKAEGGTYKSFNVKKGAAYLKISGLAAGMTYSWNVKAVGNGKDIKDSAWAVSGNDWKFTTVSFAKKNSL